MGYKHTIYWEAKQRAKKDPGFGIVELSRAGEYCRKFIRWRAPEHTIDNFVADDKFNIYFLGCLIAADIGTAVVRDVKRLTDPVERRRLRTELLRQLRSVRRPFYYEAENLRRRKLARERRKLHRRSTHAAQPTPEALLDAWNRRKESKERMILLGGLLQDLECYVDNCLKIDENGNVVGRNGGIRGWLKACLPELAPKYKTLMRYKAMAIKLRQATATEDPDPTAVVLEESPRHPVITAIFSDPRNTFASIVEILDFNLDPDTVLARPGEVLVPPG